MERTWNRLVHQYQESKEPEQRNLLVQSMVAYFPDQTWEFLQTLLWQGNTQTAIPGLLLFPIDRVSVLLQRAIVERGGDAEFLRAILSALGQIQALSLLCSLAEDLFTPSALRELCIQECTQHNTPETQALFIRELSSPSMQRKYKAILTLGQWKCRDAVPALLSMLKVHTHTGLLSPLCWALGQIASREAIYGLTHVMMAAPASVQITAADVLKQIPISRLAEPIEACLSLAHGDLQSALQQCLEQHHQTCLRQHARHLEQLRQVWEEQLFHAES